MQTILNKVQQFYNTSGEYFSKTRVWPWPEMNSILDNIKDGTKILDLGCGNGRLLNGIKAKVNYTGIDFSQTLIKEANKLHKGKKFVLANITKKVVWDKLSKYDTIFCIAVLHHIPTHAQQLFILTKAHEHLIKDGSLYLSVWNLWQLKYLKHHFSQKSLKLKLKNPNWVDIPFQHQDRFCYAFTKKHLDKLLKQTRFTNNTIFYSDRNGKKTNFVYGKNLNLKAVK